MSSWLPPGFSLGFSVRCLQELLGKYRRDGAGNFTRYDFWGILGYSPPEVNRTWSIWGSYHNISKAIFYILKGHYRLSARNISDECLVLRFLARSQSCRRDDRNYPLDKTPLRTVAVRGTDPRETLCQMLKLRSPVRRFYDRVVLNSEDSRVPPKSSTPKPPQP